MLDGFGVWGFVNVGFCKLWLLGLIGTAGMGLGYGE